MWAYVRAVDRTRLWPRLDYNLRPDKHEWLKRELFIPHADAVLPAIVFPLCNNNRRSAILAAMPRCDAQGVMGTEEDLSP